MNSPEASAACSPATSIATQLSPIHFATLTSGIGVDHVLEIRGHAVVGPLIHGQHENLGVEARPGLAVEQDVIVHQVVDLQPKGRLIRNQGCVDDAPGEHFRDLLNGRANRRCAPGLHHPSRNTRGNPVLAAGQFGGGADRLLGVNELPG